MQMSSDDKLLFRAVVAMRHLEAVCAFCDLPDSYDVALVETVQKRLGLTVGRDGDSAFALLGGDLQSGEAEFVKIADSTDQARCVAMAAATENLYLRLISDAANSAA